MLFAASPPAAKTALINSVTSTWLDLMQDCLIEIVPKLRNAVDDLIRIHFGRFKGTGLDQLVRYVWQLCAGWCLSADSNAGA